MKQSSFLAFSPDWRSTSFSCSGSFNAVAEVRICANVFFHYSSMSWSCNAATTPLRVSNRSFFILRCLFHGGQIFNLNPSFCIHVAVVVRLFFCQIHAFCSHGWLSEEDAEFGSGQCTLVGCFQGIRSVNKSQCRNGCTSKIKKNNMKKKIE